MADWKERYKKLWERFSKRQRYIMLGSALAILIAIIGVSVWYGSKPDMVPLYTKLETKDAGAVAAKLKEDKIEYKVEEGKDECSLLTCTPLGVNDHRLIVRGHRIPNQISKKSHSNHFDVSISTIIVLMIILALSFVIIVRRIKKQKVSS